MGNFFFKKGKNYKNLTNPITKSYSGDIDFDTSMELFDIDNINSREELDSFKEELIKTISNSKLKIEKLNQRFENYDNYIYKLNEHVDLIHKDLKSLLDNDKILNDKINDLVEPPSVV